MTTAPKKSIVDPSYRRVGGHKTTSTSAKVNHTSVPPRTKKVDDYQVCELNRTKKPAKRRRCHMCPVCRLEGHHARTCDKVLLVENAARADAFFTQLVDGNKVDAYIASLARRENQAFVEKVILRIRTLSQETRQPNSTTPVASGKP